MACARVGALLATLVCLGGAATGAQAQARTSPLESTSLPAPAGPRAQLSWSRDFRRFTAAQYVLTSAMAGAVLFGRDLYESGSEKAQWRGPVLFDARMRAFLAADSVDGRRTASRVSDYLMYALVAYPFIDAVAVAGVAHRNYDVAFQMTMISLQATFLQKLLSGITKNLVRRERPDEQRCAEGDPMACGARARSFFSGHTGTAFTGAALVCAHHQNLPLYGRGSAGYVACGAALGAAATVGVLRVVADRHHLTDVATGALIGVFAGYLLPNLMNYDFGRTRARSERQRDSGQALLAPLAGANVLGLQYMQIF